MTWFTCRACATQEAGRYALVGFALRRHRAVCPGPRCAGRRVNGARCVVPLPPRQSRICPPDEEMTFGGHAGGEGRTVRALPSRANREDGPRHLLVVRAFLQRSSFPEVSAPAGGRLHRLRPQGSSSRGSVRGLAPLSGTTQASLKTGLDLADNPRADLPLSWQDPRTL